MKGISLVLLTLKGVLQRKGRKKELVVVPVAQDGVKLDYDPVFLDGKSASFDIRPQIVCPSQPATLPAPFESCQDIAPT